MHYSNPHGEQLALRGSYYEYLTGDQDVIMSLRRIHDTFDVVRDKVDAQLQQTWQLHQSSSTDNL